MVSNVRPKANATPRKPIPNSGKAAEIKAAPQPPKTSQKVPRNSAMERRINDDTDTSSLQSALHWRVLNPPRRYHRSISSGERFCSPSVHDEPSAYNLHGGNCCN